MPLGAAHVATIKNAPVLLKKPSPIRTCRCQVPGQWADVCGFLEPPDSHEWKVRLHGAFSIPHSTMGLRGKDQSCHHEAWMHAPANPRARDRHDRLLHLKERSCPYELKETSRAHGGQKRPLAHVIIIHMTSARSHERNSKDLHNKGTPRPSLNDLMKPRHQFVFFCFLCGSAFRVTLASTSHCMSHCTCSYVSYFLKNNTLHGQDISSRLETSLKRKPLARAHASFHKGLKEVRGDESKKSCGLWENSSKLLCGKCDGCKVHS